MSDENLPSFPAKRPDKTIKVAVTLYFWTNDLEKLGPKHAWSRGALSVSQNKSHGINRDADAGTVRFNSLEELPEVLRKTLAEYGVELHESVSGDAGKLL